MNRRILSLLLLLVGTVFFGGYVFFFVSLDTSPDVLSVSFLDVGQGDAIFITSPTGAQVLIDAGAGGAVLRELARVMPYGDRTIDMVIATHPDMDHIGGFPEVFERYEVGMVIDPGIPHATTPYQAFILSRDMEDAITYTARRGMRFPIGGDAYIDILFPDRDVSGVDPNDGSVIVQVVYGATSFLLTGDAPQGVERWLVHLDGASLQSAVLKAGHHGSRTSTHSDFLDTVRPHTVIISAGKDNQYGHPHRDVVHAIEEAGASMVHTGEEGSIHFVSDGVSVKRK